MIFIGGRRRAEGQACNSNMQFEHLGANFNTCPEKAKRSLLINLYSQLQEFQRKH